MSLFSKKQRRRTFIFWRDVNLSYYHKFGEKISDREVLPLECSGEKNSCTVIGCVGRVSDIETKTEQQGGKK
jgi:hypothetical protein